MKTDFVNKPTIYLDQIITRLNYVINAVNLIATPEIIPINNYLVKLKNYVKFKMNDCIEKNKDSEDVNNFISENNEIDSNKSSIVINHIVNFLNKISDTIKEDTTIKISCSVILNNIGNIPDEIKNCLDEIELRYMSLFHKLKIANNKINNLEFELKKLNRENFDKLKTNDIFKVKVPKYMADRYNIKGDFTLYSYVKTIVKFLTDIDNRIAGDYTKNHRCIMPSNIAEYRECINVVIGCLIVFLEDNEEEPISNKKVSIEITDKLESNVEEDLTTLTYLELVERRNLIDQLILKKADEEIKSTVDKIYSLIKDLIDKNIDFNFDELHSKLALKFQDN